MREIKPDYETYIKSKEWKLVRQRYFKSNMPQVCFACNTKKETGFHLHHKTYKRLGKEKLTDLVLLCKECHQSCHDLQRKSGLNLWGATNLYVRNKRKKLGSNPNVFRSEHPRLKENGAV